MHVKQQTQKKTSNGRNKLSWLDKKEKVCDKPIVDT